MRLALVLGLLVGGLLLWLATDVTAPEPAPPHRASLPRDDATAGTPEEPRLRGADDAAGAAGSHRDSEASPGARDTDGAGADPWAAPVREVTGTLRILDEQGQPVPKPSGRMWLHVYDEKTGPSTLGRHVTVRVDEGAWRLEGAPYVGITPLYLEVGGRYAFLDDRLDLLDEEARAVQARLLPRSILHVLDAETDAPLAAVCIARSVERDWFEHPGRELRPEEILVDGATSPIVVPIAGWRGEARNLEIAVSAPGYAFTRLLIDLLAGGERTVRLLRAGTLRIRLTGETELEGLRIRVWRMRPTAEGEEDPGLPVLDLTPDQVRAGPVAQLVPGDYEVRAQLGSWWDDDAPALAEARGRVEAGAVADITLDVGVPAQVELVEASGILTVDPAWGEDDLNLTLNRVEPAADGRRVKRSFGRWAYDELEPVEDAPRTFRFDMGRVPPGRYRAKVYPLAFHAAVEVPRSGTRDLRIHVGAPATLVARIVDEPDGTPSEARSLFWSVRLPGPGVGVGLCEVKIPAGRETVEIRVPPCRILLDAHSEWHFGEPVHVEAPPGGRVEATVRVRPTGKVEISFREGGTQIPPDDEWEVDAYEVDGDGEACMWGWRDGRYTVWVTKPGRYRVEFGAIPGFAPVEPREVLIEAGKSTLLEIDLEE